MNFFFNPKGMSTDNETPGHDFLPELPPPPGNVTPEVKPPFMASGPKFDEGKRNQPFGYEIPFISFFSL